MSPLRKCRSFSVHNDTEWIPTTSPASHALNILYSHQRVLFPPFVFQHHLCSHLPHHHSPIFGTLTNVRRGSTRGAQRASACNQGAPEINFITPN